MNLVTKMIEKLKQNHVGKIIFINLIIFGIANLVFSIKYEQVDDFIIYNLYSGLDGTYNFHGIYIHPIICCIISIFYRIVPMINWHTCFLLFLQFVCFTIIGTIIVEKHKNNIALVLYSIFASVFYTALLLLIQYTSVAALLVLTAFFVMVHGIENKKKYKIVSGVLFTIGIMIRMQSLLIILPFLACYGLFYVIKCMQKRIEKKELIELIKQYLIFIAITGIVFLSNTIIYQTDPVYKEYMEYNDIRVVLHDMSYTDYEEYKEVFDEIGWSKNDHYLFYTFNFGDEEIYKKENLQKIVEAKKEKNEYYNLNLDLEEVTKRFSEEITNTNTYITILFLVAFFISISTNEEKVGWNVVILMITFGTNLLFIILNRSMLRVVIPEYILGTALFIYNTNWNQKEKSKITPIILILVILVTVVMSGKKYEFNYHLEDYQQYQKVIEYTNQHKENVYLYTVPSMQYRYLAYSVYQMPPKGAFSNLRVMGGWDMLTGNYYDFKERYDLRGTFEDVLKENVYVIDGEVNWSGNYYRNYINHIVLFLKEHYQKEVTYEKVEEFENISIYKMIEK